MSENFDPYLQWLGIRDPQRPPNYYRLLGVELFESDPIVLTNAVDRQMAHVRNFQSGRHSAQSQKLLNELAAAKLCLLNAQRKAQYDLQLQAQQTAAHQATPPAETQPGAAPTTAPAAAGLWPSAPRSVPAPQPTPPTNAAQAPTSSGPPALPSSSGQSSSSSLFSVAISLLVAMILILLGLIVVMATRRGEDEPPVTIENGEKEKPPAPGPEEKPDGKPEEKPAAKPQAKPEIKPEVKPEVKPKPETKPEPKTPEPTVDESVLAAREAMAKRDVEAARGHLDSAHDASVMGSPEADEVDHLNVVLGSLERFSKALQRGIAGLKTGEQLSSGESTVTVAGVADGKVTLKVGDQQQVFSAANLPAWIALAIASRELPEEDAASLMPKAAFLIFDPQGDLALAGQLCTDADQQGLLKEEVAEEWKRAVAERGIPEKEKPEPTEPERLAVPDEVARTKVLATIHELFAKEYAAVDEKPEEAKNLAKVLLAQAPQTKDNPTARYVLLTEARDLAVEAGDPYVLERALRELGRIFEVDRHAMAGNVMTEAARHARPAPANRAMAQAALKLAGAAAAADRFGAAGELIEASISMARRASDMATVKKAVAAKRDLEESEGRYKGYAAAGEVLKENPDDPTANLVRGSYLCFVKGDWEEGFPLLAKGDDPTLAALAKAEQALAGADPEEQTNDLVSLGDRWWDASVSASAGENRGKYRARAAFWYRKVVSDLSGLTRVKVQRRLDEIKP